MRVLGITAEYNPIHNGHIYHLEQSRAVSKADFIVAVMSGDFVQRGEPAVESGVDLVLELPFYFATSSAEDFARGAIGIMHGLGCVSDISFGCEYPEIGVLYQLAGFLSGEPESYSEALKEELAAGKSFPAARQAAVSSILGERAAGILEGHNNILALEYLKAIKRTGGRELRPHALRRMKGAGATESRRRLYEGGYAAAREILSPAARREIEKSGPGRLVWPEKFWPLIEARILQSGEDELAAMRGVNEGIENRFKKYIRSCDSLEEFIRKVKTRRFTRTAICRMLISILNGVKKDEFSDPYGALYARVLAAGAGGRKLLRLIGDREWAQIPLLTNINRQGADLSGEAARMLKMDILAADLYNLAAGRDLYSCSDYCMRPAML
jgi:predicted nucleotidyltransferase